MDKRKIETADGIVLCKTAFDTDTNTDYIEFYLHNGEEESMFPYDYVGESTMMKDFSAYTDSELVGLYYESV